ncbi:hypothetical protein BO71DRAFT_483669 [Aspergillus ellipticus CBS 707.79]|uniref:Heterokaryon incompatibility domain-containing protein n=1 Tax=Aspergillus ellipticus CBS 707.79 TaxID=1448320 RepID=A0A319DB95_9EURO|nr:hypothetical protein BO71DRAFT_483669 [Aspergillus ellipticus CBS 707.79]
MFKNKFGFNDLPSLKEGLLSEKPASPRDPSDAPPHDVSVQEKPAAESPLDAEKAEAQNRELLGTLRDAAFGSTLVTNALDLKNSAANEMAKIKGIVTKDGSSNDEKIRGLLHHLVRSRREAFFENDLIKKSTADDSDLLLSSFAGQVDDSSFPLRMFDVDTKNMVSTADLGEEDQYCMLSHSWKGDEINYAYVYDAQRAEHPPEWDESDVSAVLLSCDAKIKKLADKLEKLLEKRPETEKSIRKLLVRSLRAAMLERNLAQGKKKRTTEDANMRQSELEHTNYQNLLAFLQVTKEIQSLEQRKKDAKDNQEKATEAWTRAEKDYGLEKSDIDKFRSDRQLSYATDDLLKALQQRRSARKLDESVHRAREIFKNRPFSKTGKRYIWLDNCCIDKRQDAELTESLARMGEWYANADFCLVHLDTPWDNREWLDEWDLWCKLSGTVANADEDDSTRLEGDNAVASANGQVNPRSQPVMNFEEVEEWKPTWATRGWTLQELVLSKMTFYVNADWEMLSRPVDVLGCYYYFCPFVDYYTRNLSHVQELKDRDIGQMLEADDVREALDALDRETIDKEDIKTVAPDEGKEEVNVRNIIRALELFKYVAPRHLDKETARAQVTYSVQVAVKALQAQPLDTEQECHQEARKLIIRRLCDSTDSIGKQVKQTIDILLGALAQRANGPIQKDRSDIAGFSNVKDLASWSKGTEKNSFSAHSVMKLASHRECTKAIDKAYSLMGVLGVQFPAFPAEGLTKALSRLVDEVVITSNDVSVFNWTGKHNSSPLRGRSLYASNIDAFQSEDEGLQKRPDVNGELVSVLRDARIEYLKVAKGITELLLDATNFITTFYQEEFVVQTLLTLTEFIKSNELKTLKNRLGSPRLVASLKAASDYAREKKKEDRKKLEAEKQKRLDKSRVDDGSAPEPTEPERKKSRGLGGLGGLTSSLSNLPKVPSFGKETDDSTEKAEHDTNLKKFGTEIQTAFREAMDKVEPWEENAFLALEIQSPNDSRDGTMENDLSQQIVCPNPIVVNSSGIKGVFDIQRVVVKMLQPDELRAKVRNAISAKEKIDGWCTISTGFALTMMAFSCERHVLEAQLDLVDVIEKTVLDPSANDAQPKVDDTDKQNATSGNLEKPEQGDPSKDTNDASTGKPPQPERTPSGIQEPVSPDGPEQRRLGNYGFSVEQKRVSRMIDFVAESNLHAIAGEWVLARFSGAPGAKWFLCRLELGSGNEFYAHRIATDDFDFAHAVPEKGLVEFWHRFLHEKKLTMCKMLDHYLDAQKAGNYADWLKDNLGWGDSSDDEEAEKAEKTEKTQRLRGYEGLTTTSKVFKMIGWGIRYAFDELRAGYLERHLEHKALAKVPVNLHAAIKDLDANKILLPVMFHSGRDVHFF